MRQSFTTQPTQLEYEELSLGVREIEINKYQRRKSNIIIET